MPKLPKVVVEFSLKYSICSENFRGTNISPYERSVKFQFEYMLTNTMRYTHAKFCVKVCSVQNKNFAILNYIYNHTSATSEHAQHFWSEATHIRPLQID